MTEVVHLIHTLVIIWLLYVVSGSIEEKIDDLRKEIGTGKRGTPPYGE